MILVRHGARRRVGEDPASPSRSAFLSGVLAAAVLLLAGCGTSPATSNAPASAAAASSARAAAGWRDDYTQIAGKAKGRAYALDPATSAVRIFVFRGGAAARLGHVHILSAPVFEGFVFVADASLAESRFDLRFPLEKLAIDVPDVRREVGGTFSVIPSDQAVQGTRTHMLEADDLDATRFPDVIIHSVSVTGDLPRAAAMVEISLHGITRQILVPLEVTAGDADLSVSGSFVLRQTDFAIKPYSALGGLLAVEDPVVVEFHLKGQRLAGRPG